MRTLVFVLTLALLAGLSACTAPVEKYRNEGLKLYKAGQYDAALSAFKQSLAADASDPTSNAYSAAIQYRAGNLTQAAYHAKVALQFDPSNEEARNVLVVALIKQDKADQALDDLERLSELANKTADPRMYKGDGKRRYKYETEEHLFLGRADSRFQVGRGYETIGDLDNAILWYQRALKESPDSAPILFAFARVYEKAGNKPEAIRYAREAYRQNPAIPGLTDMLTRLRIAISDISGTGPSPAPLVPANP